MSCCHIKQLLKELDYCKSRMTEKSGRTAWERDYVLSQVYYQIRYHVKNHYPINGVPNRIIESLDILEKRIEIAEEQLQITCTTIINEIEKDLPV